jgi:hypothetical protein
MKRHSQLQKIISVFMIFILSIQISGCYSYKVVSGSSLPIPDPGKHHYIIYGKNEITGKKIKYKPDNTMVSNGILSGKINNTVTLFPKGDKIKVYLSSDKELKINAEDNILSVPLDGIVKVKVKSFNKAKTILLVEICGTAVLAAGSYWLVYRALKSISNLNWSFNIGHIYVGHF